MSSKVVEANAKIHSLAMAVAVSLALQHYAGRVSLALCCFSMR